MRQATLAALLTLLCFGPQPARAQQRPPGTPPPRPPAVLQPPGSVVIQQPSRGFGDPRSRVNRLTDRLRDEMWAYRQELDFFRRVPEYQQLIELRYKLRNLAMTAAESSGDGRAVFGIGREMDQAARELYALTAHLEERADLGAPQEVRRRADTLRERAVEIRVLVGRLHEAIRLDFDDRPGSSPRGPSRDTR